MILKNQDIIRKNYPSLDRKSVMRLALLLELLKANTTLSIVSLRITTETGKIYSDVYVCLTVAYYALGKSYSIVFPETLEYLVYNSLYFDVSPTMYKEAITCMNQIILTEVRHDRVY